MSDNLNIKGHQAEKMGPSGLSYLKAFQSPRSSVSSSPSNGSLAGNGNRDIEKAPMSETKEPELGQAAPTTKQQSKPKKPEPRGLKKWFFLTIWLIKDQWFLVTLACLIAISARVQVPESQQHIKETVVTYVCVSIIFFITGCTLPTRVLLDNYSRWKIHIYVQVQCFLMTSAMAFAVVSLCATNKNFMDPWLMIGLIFMGCVPTTISSNVVMTRQAHGNTALTVVQSTLGNFLGPFLTPALVSMYTSTGAWYTDVLPAGAGNYGEIYRRVFKQLGLSLFLPMAVGQVVQNVFPKECKTVFGKWKMSKVSSVALLIIIWQTFDQAFGSGAFESVKGSNIIFIVFISIAFFILWQSITLATSIFWLPKADVIACCYCCPAKTPAMGVPLSTVMYVGLSEMSKSKLQIPMVIFQGFQIASGSLLTIVFRRWVRAEEERKAAEAERLAAGTDSTPS